MSDQARKNGEVMKRGVSILELMIVATMLTLLAAISVPNWADSQRRTKLARSEASMRMVATALESYAADYSGIYPYDGALPNSMAQAYNYWYLPFTISTPVAYLSSHRVVDPFRTHSPELLPAQIASDIRYISTESTYGTAWSVYTNRSQPSVYLSAVSRDYGKYRVHSVGPDRAYGPSGYASPGTKPPYGFPPSSVSIPYDATNGVYSTGDIIRSEICPLGYPDA